MYIYLHVYVYIFICIFVDVCMHREGDRERWGRTDSAFSSGVGVKFLPPTPADTLSGTVGVP